ncbi:hypothetical protein [Roseimaritima ulvae]|uniref:Chromosome partition protein Smc n=1 Tax=Roseimaritima ulvae TaxID=980254 RepID=A0A5B9QLQ4_9BACT|nr:hypothetical protein [Roseimaritima ulvae]QEG38530.1 hypothetical protein UC8_04870 [Roseimaritima ulvae]
MPSVRLLSSHSLLAAALACALLPRPAHAQVLTGGPYQAGDRIVRNGVVEHVVAGPFFENHTGSQPSAPPSTPITPVATAQRRTAPPAANPPFAQPPVPMNYPFGPYGAPPAYPPQPAPQPPQPQTQPPPAQSLDDDSDPNGCLQPGSEIWEQLVELIRENGRLEANLEKQEEIQELKLELADQRLERELREAEQAMRAELAEQTRRLERQMVELQEARERAEQQTRVAHERAAQLMKSRDAAPDRAALQQSWNKERQRLKREIAELKKRRK